MRRVFGLKLKAPRPCVASHPGAANIVHREAVAGVRVVANLRAAGGRLGRCCRGGALIEFALVAPLLILILFGLIAFSTAIYAYTTMQSATEDAVRRMTTGSITSFTQSSVTCGTGAALTANTAENYACSKMPTWGTYSVTASQNCATLTDTVTMTANASTVALGDALGLLRGVVLTAQTTHMKEGSCS
jgi:Flp pilus assembly protein TadG